VFFYRNNAGTDFFAGPYTRPRYTARRIRDSYTKEITLFEPPDREPMVCVSRRRFTSITIINKTVRYPPKKIKKQILYNTKNT